MNKTPQIFTFLIGLVIGVVLLFNSFTGYTSPISIAIKWLGIACALLIFVKPRIAIYVISFQAFFSDFAKKVAVYYGTVAMQTIIEVMVVIALSLVAAYLGRFNQIVFSRFKDTSKWEWFFYITGLIMSFGIFLKAGGGIGGGQGALNSGVNFAIGGLLITTLKTKKDALRFFDLLLLFAFLHAAWAIKQVYAGFTTLETFYAETGLSTVASNQMLDRVGRIDPNSRPFGFGSGAPNFNMISFFPFYAFVRFLHAKNALFLIAFVVISWALFESRLKASMVICLLTPFLYFFFKTKLKTFLVYFGGVTAVGLVFINAGYFIEKLPEWNIYVTDFLGPDYNILTFTPRLEGFQEFMDPKNWSFFGLEEDVKSHDTFTSILTQLGVVPLLGVIIGAFTIAYKIHSIVFQCEDKQIRYLATALLTIALINIFRLMVVGSGFLSQPQPLVAGCFLAGAIVFVNIHHKNKANDEALS